MPPRATAPAAAERLRKQKSAPAAASTGCSPAVFAAQITEYLVRLVAERHDREQARRKEEWVNTRGSASAPMLGELLTMPPVEPPARFAEPEPEPSTYAHEPLTRVDIEDKFLLNARHGGWDDARAKATLKSLAKFYEGRIDLSALRG